jgi:hypothetical protein
MSKILIVLRWLCFGIIGRKTVKSFARKEIGLETPLVKSGVGMPVLKIEVRGFEKDHRAPPLPH